MPSKKSHRKDLAKVAKIKELAERSIRIAAILAEALKKINQDPILVGGAAVEFYTQGGYATSDIDLVAPGGPALIEVMKGLGFEKLGKDFVHQDFNIYVEFPGSALKPNERIQKIKVDSTFLSIISLEDLIVDRLYSFKFWQSGIDGYNAMLLFESGPLDEEHLLNRVREEEVGDAFQAVKEIREEVIRKKLKKDQGNKLLSKRMKALKPK